MANQPRTASRTERAVSNLASSAVAKLITLLLNFITRSVFIQYLGNTYLSVDGLYANILGMLSLAELGFGITIVYSMYRPLAERDDKKLSTLLRLYKKVYITVGAVITAVGLALIPALDFLIEMPEDVSLGALTLTLGGTSFSVSYIAVYYVLFLLNTVSSYFFWGYKRSVLQADQREYVCTNVRSVLTIGRTAIQFLLLLLLGGRDPGTAFSLYLLATVVATVAENIWVAVIAKKTYPGIKLQGAEPLSRDEKKRIVKDVGSSAVARIAHVALNSTDNLLISKLLGTLWVGRLDNYNLIISSLTGILCMFTAAITAGLGNYFVEKSREDGLALFNNVAFANLWLYGLSSVALITLMNPFMAVWLHGVEEAPDFMMSMVIVVAVTVNFFVAGYMNLLMTFRSALGLFTQGWFRPLAVAILNFACSIGLAKGFAAAGTAWLGVETGEWSLFGILAATFIARACVNMWFDPIIIHKHGFGASSKGFFGELFRTVMWTAVLCLVMAGIKQLLPVTLDMSFGRALLNFIILTVITALVCIGGFWLINHRRPSYHFFVDRIAGKLKSLANKAVNKIKRR